MKFSLVLLFVASAISLAPNGFAQGSLTPPAGPTPTMKTLDQIEPATPISSLPFTISAPGSYYLTGSLTMTTANTTAITVFTDGVTIDLKGFSLIGNSTSTGITLSYVHALLPTKGAIVRNGCLSNWGVQAINSLASNAALHLEKLVIFNNTSSGVPVVAAGAATIVKDCVFNNNSGSFCLSVDKDSAISGCTCASNTASGFSLISHGTITNSTAAECKQGITTGANCTIADCTASGSLTVGISTGDYNSIVHCTASNNGSSGISTGTGCTVADCTVGANGSTAVAGALVVQNGCNVHNCTVRGNVNSGITGVSGNNIVGNTCDANNSNNGSSAAGIYLTGFGNRIDSNNITANTYAGLQATHSGNIIVRNTFSGSAYITASGNTLGPFADMSVAGGTISNTNPWTNFYY